MNIYSLEPVWHKNTQPEMPSELTIADSMTKYMQQASKQSFQVKLLAQTFKNPRPSEAFLLSISKYRGVMVREVYLLCDDQICMFARSLFPIDTLFGKGWQLQYLGEKPLGSLLFNDPKLGRSPFDFVKLHFWDEDYEKATTHLAIKPDFLWARRSVFYWHQKELMVEEVFLPHFLDKVLCGQDINF